MKFNILCLVSCFLSATVFGECIPLNSEEGQRRLERSERAPFDALYNRHEKQLKNYCGVASSVMVLNALSLTNDDGNLLSQHTFFTDPIREIISPETVSKQGFTFRNLITCLNTFPSLYAEGIYGDLFDSPDNLGEALTRLMSAG